MLPSDSSGTLTQFLNDQGLDAESAPLDRVIAAFLEFYATVRAADLSPAPESDMLLFQYGVYDWGAGELFELDIARQFIAAVPNDDDAISQLHCTTMFVPTSDLMAIQPWNVWCQDRAGLGEFNEIILSSIGYQGVLRENPVRREIRWEQV